MNPPTARSPRGGIDLAACPETLRGDIRLLPAALTLQGPRQAVTLEPRVMQVLVHLAGCAPQVASREALLQACWGAVVVGDDALHRAVAGARRALREVGSTGVSLETIPRVGYRLLADGVCDAPAAALPAEAGAPTAGVMPLDAGAATASAPALPAAPEGQASPGPDAAAAPPITRPADAPRPGRPVAAWPARRWWVLGLAAAAATVGATWVTWRHEPLPHTVQALLDQGRRELRLALPRADRQGVQAFEQAVAVAPRHAPAWGLLALARRQAADFAPPQAAADLLAGVEAAAARALALDPRQPDALTARALLQPLLGHWAEVEQRLEAVLAIAPDHLPALDALAFAMASTGVLAAHYPLRLRTVALDPLHAGYNFRSIFSHWMNGQVAAADRAGERGLDIWPRHLATWLARCMVFNGTGRAGRTLALLDDESSRPELPPALLQTMRATARALASGQPADGAQARDAALVSVARGGPVAAVGATMDLAALGETDLALDVTEAYLLERGPLMAGTGWRSGQPLHNDMRRRLTNHLFLPVTAPLRAHPRFARLMQDIGLSGHWAQSARQPDHLAATGG